jgi:hypothetical protein
MGKTYLQGEPLTAADLNASLSEAVNTSGYYVFAGIPAATAEYGYPFYTGEHVHNAKLTANGGFEVNTSPSNFYSTSNYYNNISVKSGSLTLDTGNITVSTGSITATQGGITASAGAVSDSKGNVRKVPETFTTTPYTLQASDSGKVVRTVNQQITVPANVFNNGDTVTILNWSGTPTTIVKGAGLATMYWAGNNLEGNRTIGWLGLCTILFVASNECVIAGSGLS